MVRTRHRLNARQVTHAKPGMHADGGGLWLRVQSGGRSWIFRYKSPATGKERLMGLGPSPDVSLLKARKAADAARLVVLDKRDPLDERRARDAATKGLRMVTLTSTFWPTTKCAADKVAQPPARHRELLMTFQTAAETYIAAHRAGWRNPKHADQWTATLTQHVFPMLGSKAVARVQTADVMKVLEPVWTTIPETATRLRGRIELVLDFAAAKGWRSGDNLARWRGHIAHMLPRRSKVAKVVHHSTLPYKQIAAVVAKLAEGKGTAALAVRFVTLTAARSSEVRGATWSEIDLEEKVWTVPGERMKAAVNRRGKLTP